MTTWQHWWDFNQDEHLRPRHEHRQAVITGSDNFYLGATRRQVRRSLLPETAIVVGKVLPSLAHAVEVGPRDVTVSSMLALARIGLDHPDFRLFDVFSPRLADGDQTIRETAALSLGLGGVNDPRCRLRLIDVLRDNAAGRRAVGSSVDDRTRSFAAYGLGLLANRTDSTATKRRVFEALQSVLFDRGIRSRDLRVATLQAIGLLDVDQHKYEGARLAAEVLACLDRYFTADLGVGEQYMQAHCPTAIARLLGRDHVQAERYKEQFAEVLSGKGLDGRSRKSRRVNHAVSQSCALALGQLCRPNEDGNQADNGDVRFSKVLLATWRDHKDAQTRNFALLALGQIGGAENKNVLLREFDKATANIEQPWCALALGLYGNGLRERAGSSDRMIGDTLLGEFEGSKNPEATAALAIALGLAGVETAAVPLTERLYANISRETLAAALCQGLALLGEVGGRAALHEVLGAADRRPQLMTTAAVALGRLGDPDVGEVLMKRLTDGEANHGMRIALSMALTHIGDRQQIEPLIAMLADSGRSMTERAGAAQALGGIGDYQHFRWNTPLRANTNYRASVATLTDQFSGVLDLR